MWDDSLDGLLFSSSPIGGTSAPLYPVLLAKDEEEVNCTFCWTQLMRLCKPVNTQNRHACVFTVLQPGTGVILKNDSLSIPSKLLSIRIIDHALYTVGRSLSSALKDRS